MNQFVVNFLDDAIYDNSSELFWLSFAFRSFGSIDLKHNPQSKTAMISMNGATTSNLEKIDADTIIVFDLFHYDHYYNKKYQKLVNITDKKIKCLTNNFKLKELINAEVIEFDYLFNRSKMIYTDQMQLSKKRSDLQYYEPFSTYELTYLSSQDINKHYLALARSLVGKRPDLIRYLVENFNDQGLIGCKGLGRTVDDQLIRGYTPVSQKIYDQTICSIYIESTTENTISFVTEKTFEPLLKGNFILPFSDIDFVNTLKTRYGFQLPTIINYDYGDNFDKFLSEVHRFCSLSINDLRDYYHNNIHILEENRQVFFDRPYDNSIVKLLG